MSAVFTDTEAAHERRLLKAEPPASKISEGRVAFEEARLRFKRSTTAEDLAELVCDDEVLARLLRQHEPNANEIGRHLLSVHGAWLNRLAHGEVFA